MKFTLDKISWHYYKKDSACQRGRFITLIMSDQHGILLTIFNEDIFELCIT
jgi:hypothetical protein